MLRFHDDESVSRLRMLWRDEQIDVLENTAARLVQDELAQAAVGRDPPGLLPQRVAGRRGHATDDHIADFALGMARNDMNQL